MKWNPFGVIFAVAPRWIVVSLLLVLLVRGGAAQEADQSNGGDPAEEPTPAGTAGESSVSPATISEWVEQLEDDRYEIRERASRSLLEHGRAALEPLADAADGPRPEAAARAVVILEELAERAEDSQFKLAVLERLVGLKRRASVSRRAEEKLAAVLEEISLPIALEMGGRFDPDAAFFDPASGQQRFVKFIIGPDWTGGDEGLVHVARLGHIHTLSIRRAAISFEALEHLANMRSLQRLELYGMDIDRERQRRLENVLPQVTWFDIRRGAMLGVRGSRQAAIAQVESVEPGSAAAAAGLQARDVITKVDGVDVQSFEELTAEIAKHDPGDTAVLQLIRGGEVIERKVVFGQWE